MKYAIAALLLIWSGLLVSTVARADAVTGACYAPELIDGRPLPALGMGHLNRCWQTATAMIGAIHEDGLACTQIVAYSLSVGSATRMTVVCRTGAPQFSNYVSINGGAFGAAK